MFYLNEMLLKEELPARARRLFIDTFRKYHKLDGGDENIALHLAFKAIERRYVKLNNKWIPKAAAEEIVRHDIDEDNALRDIDEQRRGKSERARRRGLDARQRVQRTSMPVVHDEAFFSSDDDDADERPFPFRSYRRAAFSDEDEDEHEDAEDRSGRKRKRSLSQFE
ncbi:ORF58 [Lymantria xylina nucleopolyhedrovirus]|uniref:ORF58 n=1 Tax=Lymantria xylina multiple nucleopolyhedrovirus TaxID=2847840 RepID=D4N295_9ABAC|nr:ORF58 [Lymantria xylina nucleopolyhedrovirus]ADD73767.1 ORF58 [Lymantria xylina nucleopolyhedrovirus]